MECPEDMDNNLALSNGFASFELGTSKSFPMELISSRKCLIVDDEIWTKQYDKKEAQVSNIYYHIKHIAGTNFLMLIWDFLSNN